jgi:hypothetical protein
MAEFGEWNRKGAALSEVTAEKEYGVTRDFIVKGIQAGKLEYRDGAVWGNPYLRVLRSQLERYIVAQLGSEYLVSKKSQTELRAISKEIADLRKKLAALEARKTDLSARSRHSGRGGARCGRIESMSRWTATRQSCWIGTRRNLVKRLL